MKELWKALGRFRSDLRGNFTTMFALTLFPVAFTIGVSVDYSDMARERSRMQETADSAALYAVKQMQEAGYGQTAITPIAKDVILANFDIEGSLTLELDKQDKKVRVHLKKEYDPAIVQLFYKKPLDLSVLSEVSYDETLGKTAKCFIALARTGTAILSLNGNAKVDASSCDVHVNSNSNTSVALDGNGTEILAHTNCFVGDVKTGLNRVSPPPEDDCYVMPDPFADYKTPSIGACDETDFKITGNRETEIDPGADEYMVFCGGIEVGSGADVTFKPGIYIVKGAFKTTGNAYLRGDGVTFVFVGEDAAVQFSGGTTFHFVAMDDGPLAGFLFFFDEGAGTSNNNYFSGNSDTYFEGILSFGDRDVAVSGESEVNSGSPLSVIAAREITLNGNGTVFFNVDKDATSLPVPDILYEKTIAMHLSQ